MVEALSYSGATESDWFSIAGTLASTITTVISDGNADHQPTGGAETDGEAVRSR
jgi:hypothetical protein